MEQALDRAPGLSVRLKLTLSYAGFLMVAGGLLLAAAWVFLLRDQPVSIFVPDLSDLLRAFDTDNFGPVVFGAATVVVLSFLLVFGLLGGWFLAGRMLAPLVRVTHATRLASDGSLSHRIRLPGRRDEFRELADSFDGMLARLEAHVAEQRRFAANASHELRTPLTIAQTLLEVARKDPDLDCDALIERLQVINARAIALTEALLLLSRAEQGAFARGTVDLSLLAEEAVETLLPLAEERAVTIESSGEPALTIGSEVLLQQLTINLVHNAIIHNLPDRGTICIKTGFDADAAVLTIENSGDRLDSDLLSTLTEPFRRGAERVHSAVGGAGLGLAIVESIADAHGGALTIAPRASGGLCVEVRLPVAPVHERGTSGNEAHIALTGLPSHR